MSKQSQDRKPENDRKSSDGRPAVIAGIGASARDSLRRFFSRMPAGHGIAFVIVQPAGTSAETLAIESLQEMTTLDVAAAAEGMPVASDRIHVMPPGKFLNITSGILTFYEPVECSSLPMPIDHFFCSLGVDQGSRALGVLLSGAGSDGIMGLSQIRAEGGKIFIEDPGNAGFSEAAETAIQSEAVDAVLPAESLAGAIVLLADQIQAGIQCDPESAETHADLAVILEILFEKAGHDFRCYKTSTLVRRIRRRMALTGHYTFSDYIRFLSEHPSEISLLKKDLLIGVTEFFRQPEAWKVLAEKVVSSLIADADPQRGLRIWVPGCSTGKEVYSLAMLFSEQMEKSGKKVPIQIFATDSDIAALAAARSGSYAEEDLGEAVSPERRLRFFARRDGLWQIVKELREQVVFAPQNLTSDPPFSKLDLISCRNLLIYIEAEVQKKIIALFHFALREGGFLFLGSAETIGEREDIFTPVSKKMRIYRRIGVGRRVGVEIPMRPSGGIQPAGMVAPAVSAARMSLSAAAQQVLLDRFAPACVMIDRKLHVLFVHGPVEDYLTIPAGELSTRIVDMAREGLRARLRGAIAKSLETNRPVSVTARVRRGEKSLPVRAVASPLRHPREADGLVLVTFEDYRPSLAGQRRKSGQDESVQQLEDELKVTREELQSTIEQLENSNDQLKASNEEVTASNEELQSANEELETSKEELQSLNEELNTINARLHEKVEELESFNNDVVNLLSSTNIATVFLDKELKVRRYTPASTHLFSLIPSDLGRPIGDVLRRFSDDALLEDAGRVLAELAPLSREVQADDARWYTRRITPYRTQDDRIEGVVITFAEVSDLKQTEQALREAKQRAERLARFPEENPNPIVRVSTQGRVLYRNPGAVKLPGWACEAGQALPAALLPLVAEAMAQGGQVQGDVDLGGRFYSVAVAPFPAEQYANLYGRDITERKRAEEALRESEQRVRLKLETILLPEGDIGKLNLADIIDTGAIQAFMNDFYTLAKVPMSIVDLEGKLLVGVGWQDICTRFHRAHPETCRHCIESDIQLSAGIPPGESRLYKCRNNMWDIATPILVGGKHMGNIFSGQFFFEDEEPDYVFFQSQAKRYGFDETAYLAAMQAVPRLSRDTVDTGMAFFMKLADMISKLSYGNVKLARSLAQQDALMDSLNESRKDLNRAQAVAKTGSWRLDVRKNELLWSEEVYRIFAIPEGTALSYEAFLDAIYPDDREHVDRQWAAALIGAPYDIEHRIVAGDTIKWVREKAELELDQEGNLLGGFGTVQDITERKLMEEKLRRSRDELEARVQERTIELKRRAEQLSLLASELTLTEERERRRLAEILHDHLQQLLVGARLNLESLAGQIPEDRQPIFNNVCNLLKESIETSRSLTAELSPPILYERGLTAALEWLARWMQEKYKLNVILQADQEIGVDHEDMMVLLFQSVRELLFNVVKHAGVNSAAVRMSREDSEHLRIVVSDRGTGFDPQRRWEEGEPASGFGMFTIRERLELLGGRFEVESAPGKGAAFTLIAPVRQAELLEKSDAAAVGAGSAAQVVPSAGSTKIEDRIRLMLADDHIVMRQGLSIMLNAHADIEIVAQAADGEAAVQLARKLNPDVILMDISMPKMNGIEATRIIHAEQPQIRIIGLSMYDDSDIAASILGAGAAAYLTKAGSTEGLLAAIRGEETKNDGVGPPD